VMDGFKPSVSGLVVKCSTTSPNDTKKLFSINFVQNELMIDLSTPVA
jgi:hypothetical protein